MLFVPVLLPSLPLLIINAAAVATTTKNNNNTITTTTSCKEIICSHTHSSDIVQ